VKPIEYAVANQSRFLEELLEYLRIPSISTDVEHKGEVERCANWLADHLREIGVKHVEVEKTGGHPIVYAEHIEDPDAPTYLLYGHYDVQPPDPLELWTSPPFEPDIRDGKIFARGATDDKGQLFCHVKAIEAHLKTNGRLPVNVKMLIEGEEEVGSMHLTPWVESNRERLKCDAVVISDSSMYAPGVPSIMYGLRGLAYFELKVTGPSHDLHSGLYGGAAQNPINVLCELIASLHDTEGRITVAGFYDAVRDLSESERAEFAALPFSEDQFLAEIGARGTIGEAGYTTIERTTARPGRQNRPAVVRVRQVVLPSGARSIAGRGRTPRARPPRGGGSGGGRDRVHRSPRRVAGDHRAGQQRGASRDARFRKVVGRKDRFHSWRGKHPRCRDVRSGVERTDGVDGVWLHRRSPA
jgi:acetylornithine deacetylase/succinyl-diaminopimelate desuccinylase-like protein